MEQQWLEVLPHPSYSPDLLPPVTIIFWVDEENAKWAEMHIKYRGAASRSSVAWTAASIVLCIGHSEAC